MSDEISTEVMIKVGVCVDGDTLIPFAVSYDPALVLRITKGILGQTHTADFLDDQGNLRDDFLKHRDRNSRRLMAVTDRS